MAVGTSGERADDEACRRVDTELTIMLIKPSSDIRASEIMIPWVGVPLVNLIKKVQPTSKAKYVEFTSVADTKTMPGVRNPILRWPYREGLRMDEAMHPLR